MRMTELESIALWDQGYRAWEIYVRNDAPVEYCGKRCEAGEIAGWEIQMVIAKREELPAYPHFDAVIMISDFSTVQYVWMNGERIEMKGDTK